MMLYEKFIRRSLVLARRGKGKTKTNPLVGAVLVNAMDGKILAEGYHKGYGMPHAEVDCLKNAEKNGLADFANTILFVNLEPCCHWGKTPPCTDLIISKKIPRVVFGTLDPFKEVSGKGASVLKAAGVQVDYGFLESDCLELNRVFFKHITKKMPYVMLKIAQTLDGKIATVSGDSKWITSEASRKIVHKMRSEYDAIMIGAETARSDNPSLTIRHVKGRQPFRVVVDGHLRVSDKLKIFNDEFATRTILCTSETSSKKKIASLEKKGVKVWRFPTKNSHIELRQILRQLLMNEKITSVMVEGGGVILGQFLKEKLADEVNIFIAPKILGDGRNAISGVLSKRIKDAVDLQDSSIKKSGRDFYLRARFQ